MTRRLCTSIGVLLCGIFFATSSFADPDFIRGDVDSNGSVAHADWVCLGNWLFGGSHCNPDCRDAMDVNDSGSVNITDWINLNNFVHNGTWGPPSAPYPDCGRGPEDTDGDGIGCDSFPYCE